MHHKYAPKYMYKYHLPFRIVSGLFFEIPLNYGGKKGKTKRIYPEPNSSKPIMISTLYSIRSPLWDDFKTQISEMELE